MLRKEKDIKINGERVMVFELDVTQLPDAMVLMDVLVKHSAEPLLEVIRSVFTEARDTAMRLLSGATDQGAAACGFGGVALVRVVEAWLEVNTDFFDLMFAQATQSPGEHPETEAGTPPPTA
ncbi:hypothetical protein G3N56_07835 [Desulfovibrio sulfodismutans]|uniref:Uncharacterized protein n=1 Tax=Desulfolutivibrio sulfodismutans TaxID=63561 RepID=A0A7K3NKF0_9BACT|nr:hypothetical protein [Desulfolutivibrio sulfodismutans]NDY56652.1 hypothetical protein [Desulfolutivibrio sulfodismutans]QLA11248.1 hypothetical protein GD606_02625 [Desulfolutivibrio sulfodismutans DSM 3696]